MGAGKVDGCPGIRAITNRTVGQTSERNADRQCRRALVERSPGVVIANNTAKRPYRRVTMFGAECADGMTLLPLKMNHCPGDQRAHRPEAHGPGGSDRRPGRNSSRCRDQQDRVATPANRPFVDTPEWRWTRDLCAGLFSALGRYYDEKWFPTVVREWCLLYYRCAHADDYWQARDEFLAGDQEIRMAVWTEVLAERAENEQRLAELRRQAACNENVNGDDDFVDEEEAQKVGYAYDSLENRLGSGVFATIVKIVR